MKTMKTTYAEILLKAQAISPNAMVRVGASQEWEIYIPTELVVEDEMPESYNHVPLMVYGKNITPAHHTGYGGQVDVAPTLFDLLGISYTQNNFGINLLKEERPCIFYTADNLIAARDSSHLYIHSPETGQAFCYIQQEGKWHSTQYDASFKTLKEYVFSMLQATEQLVKEGRTTDKPKINE